MTTLNPENYSQGFLIDDDLMAGVTQDPEKPGVYAAFVIQHTTGNYLGYQIFSVLDEALRTINQIPRPWVFEKVGGCGSGNCGKEGGCSKGKCQVGKCKDGSC